MRELEKISSMHKRGKFDMPEKDFLELVMCPYEGNGIMDKKPLKKFLREREELEKTLSENKVNLKLAVDRAKYTQVTGIEEEADRKIKAHVSKKAQKEDEEKKKKEKERHELEVYRNLADSVLVEMQKRRNNSSYVEDESLIGPNRRKTTHFAEHVDYVHTDSLDDEEDEEEEGQPVHEGPRYQRAHPAPIELPLHSSEDL